MNVTINVTVAVMFDIFFSLTSSKIILWIIITVFPYLLYGFTLLLSQLAFLILEYDRYKKNSLEELEVIYDNMDEETQKWMLDNLYLWFGKEKSE